VVSVAVLVVVVAGPASRSQHDRPVQRCDMSCLRASPCLASFFLAIAPGCGSSPSEQATSDAALPITDISGWYQVTSDLEGSCGATKPSSLGPAYIWAERRQDTFIVRACTTAASADCTGTLFYDFTQSIDGGMAAEGGSAFYSAGCTLTYERAEARLAGSNLTVRSLKYSTNQDLAQTACTLAAARALTQPCTYEVDLTASRL
jgi:hypothetical protein